MPKGVPKALEHTGVPSPPKMKDVSEALPRVAGDAVDNPPGKGMLKPATKTEMLQELLGFTQQPRIPGTRSSMQG